MKTLVKLILIGALAVPLAVAAQAFPSKPLKMVTGFSPGGSADLAARTMAQKMSEGLRQQVIVENRTGAGSLLAHEYVAKAPPDGHTILLMAGGFPVQPAMLKSLPYDAVRDFAMISMLVRFPFVLIVHPESGIADSEAFIRHVKANPGRLSYGSSGVGSIHHMASELFNAMAGTDIQHVPFRGGNAQIMELMASRVQLVFEALPNAMPFIKSGKVKPLAVTSATPSPFLPEVPPMARALPGYDVSSFFALATTAGTPAAVVAQLNAETRRVLMLPDVQKRFLDLGGEARATSPEEMQQFIQREIAKWKQVVEQRKIERI